MSYKYGELQSGLLTTIKRDLVNFKKSPKERLTRSYVAARLAKLEQDIATSKVYNEAIIGGNHLETTMKKEDLLDVYDQILDISMDYRVELMEASERHKPVPTADVNAACSDATSQQSSSRSEIRLPRIDLPKFDGAYTSWRTFHDRFGALVHNNSSLADIDKLHFLQSCLVGDAERFLQNLSVEAANYEKAWELLKERYDHKRILVHLQMQALFGQSPMARETATGLKELLFTTRECMSALENMDVPVDQWDTVLIWFLHQKLPSSTQKLWEEKMGNRKDLPKFVEFSDFLDTRFRTLEVVDQQEMCSASKMKAETFATNRSRFQSTKVMFATPASKPTGKPASRQVGRPAVRPTFNRESGMCSLCNLQQHSIRKCQRFLNMDTAERKQTARRMRVCDNCLSSGHFAQDCPSPGCCYFCQQRHHTLLHANVAQHATVRANSITPSRSTTTSRGNNAISHSFNANALEFEPREVQQASTSGQVLNYHTSHGSRTHQVLLATAIVKVRAADGRQHHLRALIDPGSEACFITEDAAQQLKLKKQRTFVEVSGLGLVSSGTTQTCVDIELASCNSTYGGAVRALVFKSLTGHLPAQQMIPDKWQHLKGLTLADPNLHVPGPINLLLGSEVYADILLPEVRRPADGVGPTAQKTQLGWIVLGKVQAEHPRQIRSFVQTADLNSQLQRFWEMEELPFQTHETEENIACDAHFNEHTIRFPDGRYEVKLPFKGGCLPAMGSSKQSAVRRFLHLEKRLEANPTLRADYAKCIQEYATLGHMEEIHVGDSVLATPYHYFLPHHAVFKESSSTTKLRVVFDATAKTLDGSSLNDRLLVGPKLQSSIIDLVLRWRTHRITFTADIEKMYRQVLVDTPDTYYQLILWRNDRLSPIKMYRLKTVTFGTASAPYLAIKILKRVAEEEESHLPEGAKVVREDMYVDDLISGADTVEEARTKRDQANQLLASAGFNLRKWTSNVKELVEDIPVADRELDFEVPFNMSNHVKTLGIKWFPVDDYFSYQNVQQSSEATTKRSMLSTIAKLFDPLGWISPCVITAKLMMQRLWELSCDWDDPVPATLKKDWDAFHGELPMIETLRIPRWTQISKTNKDIELHGFCDASMKAYGAVVYVRVLDSDGSIQVNLLLAKTKVAPSQRTITLPRLELCGAVVLAQLMQYTKDVLAVPDIKMFTWTDSTIALAWIRATPAKWTTFVANRVSEIQRLVGIDCWGHVATLHNPADLASRGVYPAELTSLQTWWIGPEFLRSQWTFDVPHQPVDIETDEERRTVKVLSAQVNQDDRILQTICDCSSLLKVIRVIATCCRFATKCRRKAVFDGPLSPSELKAARIIVVKAAQKEMFKSELQQIVETSKIPKSLKTLNAFVDADGLLRVGGRLENSLLPYDAQHPILLQNSHHFTNLVVRDAHKNTLHGGIQQMISYIRQMYWIGQIRRSVKYQLHRCTSCYRQKASEMQQLMANLPAPRVQMSRPFSHTGVDYAGPIEMKSWKARGAKILKGYFAVFICLATKAIHLEVVSDLTTQAFLAAFRRFTARRGSCKQIYSDCGTNFVGANNELAKMLKDAKHDFKEIAENLSNHGTNWHFIPPASPHFGGLWEAGVKSVKYHLKRVVGTERLTFEELTTLLTQIEACLNSRPLCPLSDSLDDLNALTPAHFLVGESLHAVPQGELNNDITYIDRWKKVQALAEGFWKKWNSEYLARLQQRPKWTQVQEAPKIGDLVLLKDERLAPTYWSLARIEDTHAGTDGLIRVVTVKTQNGKFKRPIAKICSLPSNKHPEQSARV